MTFEEYQKEAVKLRDRAARVHSKIEGDIYTWEMEVEDEK